MADYPISIDAVRNMLLRLKHCHSPEYIDLGISMALCKLEGFPPMDVATVVHGRWLPGVPITCSLCGNPAAEHGSATVFWLSPYCPWCGQPMDAKEVDADGQEGT